MLDIAIKWACLIDVAIPDSHHSTIIDDLQKYTDVQEDPKEWAAERSLCSTINVVHNGHQHKNTTRQLETAQSLQKAVKLKTSYS
jgi:hypothetical protein